MALHYNEDKDLMMIMTLQNRSRTLCNIEHFELQGFKVWWSSHGIISLVYNNLKPASIVNSEDIYF